jgi:hypothetical protein
VCLVYVYVHVLVHVYVHKQRGVGRRRGGDRRTKRIGKRGTGVRMLMEL